MNATLEIPRGFTGALSRAGLAIGDGAKTGVALAAPNGAGTDYAIDGLAYHKADSATNLPLTGATQADLTTCLYLVQINAAGTVSFVKGVEELTADLTAGKRVLHWPAPTAANCPIGAVKVLTSGATFVPGTTALDAATVTETYYNFGGGMPVDPLTS